MSHTPSAPPNKLRSVVGGQQGRADPVTIEAPKYLSALAAKVWRELAPGVFRTSTLDMVNCDVVAGYCEVLAAAWSAEHGAKAPELAGQLAEDLKLSPASRRRLERLALSKNERTSDDVSQWS